MPYNPSEQPIITPVALSTHEVVTDNDVLSNLKNNEWDVQPHSTAQGLFFYNKSRNGAIVVAQEGPSCVRISVVSLADPQNAPLRDRICSSIGHARRFLVNATADFKDYNPFEQQNDIRAIFGQ